MSDDNFTGFRHIGFDAGVLALISVDAKILNGEDNAALDIAERAVRILALAKRQDPWSAPCLAAGTLSNVVLLTQYAECYVRAAKGHAFN